MQNLGFYLGKTRLRPRPNLPSANRASGGGFAQFSCLRFAASASPGNLSRVGSVESGPPVGVRDKAVPITRGVQGLVRSVPSVSVVGAVAPLRERSEASHVLHRYRSFRGRGSSRRGAFPDPQPNQPFNLTLDRFVPALPLRSSPSSAG